MLTVNFYGTQPALKMPTDSDQTVEDLLVAAARVLEIGPVCCHLFGLRRPDGLWLAISKKISTLPENTSVQFRLRFRPNSLQRLKKLDINAFEYLFLQVRTDFQASHIPELIKHPEDGLGLVVTDILLYLRNNPDKKVGDVNIKSFMPKELNGLANRFNVQRNVSQYLDAWRVKDAAFVHERYLSKVEERQCSYGIEEYVMQMDEAGKDFTVRMVIDAFHAEHPGIRYRYASQKKGPWKPLCRIEELVFVSTRFLDLTVEISRETGVPCYCKLQTRDQLESFVGCLNGYYRLLRNWNFDLCQELSTPSLLNLRSNKCHGPVGEMFATKKLKEKGGGEVGVSLVRESSTDHDIYKLDVITEQYKAPSTFTIRKESGKVHLEGKEEMYNSLKHLLRDLMQSDILGVKLSRILPPSDYDKAEMLLVSACREKQVNNNILSGPRIISMEHLMATEHNIKRGTFSNLIKARWNGKEDCEVAVKVPKVKTEEERNLFLSMLNQFAFVSCECIVSVFGVTLSPLSLVMEYASLGDLSTYLQRNKNVKEVELVEAATYLARALWYLNQEGIQHNNIRCHNILVSEHTEQTLKVKLGDPGLVKYSQKDIHWIPREYHSQPSLAIRDITTDVWAFSTTLWQIFSGGVTPLPDADIEEVRKLYAADHLLGRPDLCPVDLYKVMKRCWSRDPQARRQPQAIMRDVNQILYQVFNSRKNHDYQTVLPDSSTTTEKEGDEDSNSDVDDENGSVSTQLTTLTFSDGTVKEVVMNMWMDVVDNLVPIDSLTSTYNGFYSDSSSPDTGIPNPLESPERSPGSPHARVALSELCKVLLLPEDAPRIPERPAIPTEPLQLDKSAITFDIKIGEGFYGVVFKGKMKDPSGHVETVAIKTLKAAGQIEDHMREINIMKKLNHKNVVRLCGLCEADGDEVYMIMEYLKEGSLKAYILRCKDHIKISNLLKFALDIAEGMDYLEQKRIIHRDLAARNVLVADENTVKITDFGLAQQPNKGNYYIRQTVRALPLLWYALECIEKEQYSHKSDVWSYGVTCWEMFTHGAEPDLPEKSEELIKALRYGRRLTCKRPCEPNIYSKLILPCWDFDPVSRPNFSALISTVKELQEEYM